MASSSTGRVECPEKRMESAERVTVRVDGRQLDRIETLVEDGIYKDRSKAIRDGIDKLLDDLEDEGVSES